MSALAVPQPPPHPIFQNAPDMGLEAPIQSLMGLATEYGPCFKLALPGRGMLVVSNHALVDELCASGDYEKALSGPLETLRDVAGDGLFTARPGEASWGRAHRLLAPAFGPLAMRSYFDRMKVIADQLVDRWARLGPSVPIDVADDMTRLTLDTIALCGFDYRFHSFYQTELHPFVGAMVRALAEAYTRSTQLPIQRVLRLSATRRYRRDIALMNEVVDQVITERRAQGDTADNSDLLGRMLTAVDPRTGEGLSDENIRFQIVTFLIAGHETTSGLLSFAVHFLLQNPDVLARAKAEVDRVLGGDAPRFEHLQQLTYIDQVLRETLRLWPTAPAFALQPKAPTTLGGRYPVTPDDQLVVLIPTLHRDPTVWADPEAFDPDRFAPERRSTIPAHAWKPFGHGQRACIGRLFALQEATLVLAMVLQRFDFIDGHDTPLRIKETLTLKPDGLFVRVRPRADRPVPPSAAPVPVAPVALPHHGTPLRVLFGSNTGTAESFAQRIAESGRRSGYRVTLSPMDAAVDNLPTDGALVVVTASYNGQPPDNARLFCDWLDALPDGALAGLNTAVLGCGHRDWAQTFQAVPARVEHALERLGTTSLVDRGALDGALDLEEQVGTWLQDFWPATHRAFDVDAAPEAPASTAPLQLTLLDPTDPLARVHGLQPARIERVRQLVDTTVPFARSKLSVTLRLPDGMAYRPGQHLEVLGMNRSERVAAWLTWLDLPGHTLVQRAAGGRGLLPTDRPVSLAETLERYVDLGAPASLRALQAVLAAVRCPPERAALQRWLADPSAYETEVRAPRRDLLTVLTACPSVRLPLADIFDLLVPMVPRRYSISSSPRVDPTLCTLTVAHVTGPALAGSGSYEGVASGTLARAQPGDRLLVAVREPHGPFALPENDATPVVFIGAGTGIAPFMGFLEDRAMRAFAGDTLGPAHLFFGCDHPEVDFLYRPELEEWASTGLVRVHTAFFQQPDGDITFVQHRLWAERARVADLIRRGAVFYICGDGARMAPGVREVLARILAELLQEADGTALFDRWIEEGRLQLDVFGSVSEAPTVSR